MTKKRLFQIVILSLVINVWWGTAFCGEIKKITAVAKKSPQVLPNDPKQLDFVFDKPSGLNAWLRDNGDVYVEGYIRHNHFRCGTYQLGIKFGKGEGCVNVQWLSDPVYTGGRRQCNQAVLHHDGYQHVQLAEGKFDEVTCAQLSIKCEGVCGITDIPRGGSSEGFLR